MEVLIRDDDVLDCFVLDVRLEPGQWRVSRYPVWVESVHFSIRRTLEFGRGFCGLEVFVPLAGVEHRTKTVLGISETHARHMFCPDESVGGHFFG